MRKRSKYRPKKVLANPLGNVLEGLVPVSQHDTYLVDLQIKNHAAMKALTTGKATKEDFQLLLGMNNMANAFFEMKFGDQYEKELRAGGEALIAIGKRARQNGKFTIRAHEMNDLNTLMDLFDAQLGIARVKDIDDALAFINKEERARRYTVRSELA